MSNITDALGWFAGTFYVLVALSVVYLFFFRIVPLVFTGIQWTIWSVVRSVLVLAVLAFLIGCVAIFTADWIFTQVFDTLPRTRMAQEIDRITGSVVRLSADTYDPYAASAGPVYPFPLPGSGGAGAPPGMAPSPAPIPGAPQPAPPDTPTAQLKPNALELWASSIQTKFNPTGNITDNTLVMNRREIPMGVVCEVAAVSSGWRRTRNEEWRLLCTTDNFRTTVTIPLNGTAARGLTGGSYYSLENPYTIYGNGPWPDIAYEPLPTPTPPADEATPEGGPQLEETPASPAREHRVRPGESLAAIAHNYNITVPTLVQANQQKYPQLQANPNVIVVGWVLAIPEQR